MSTVGHHEANLLTPVAFITGHRGDRMKSVLLLVPLAACAPEYGDPGDWEAAHAACRDGLVESDELTVLFVSEDCANQVSSDFGFSADRFPNLTQLLAESVFLHADIDKGPKTARQTLGTEGEAYRQLPRYITGVESGQALRIDMQSGVMRWNDSANQGLPGIFHEAGHRISQTNHVACGPNKTALSHGCDATVSGAYGWAWAAEEALFINKLSLFPAEDEKYCGAINGC